ncbi:MAG: response regulator transcription factor [Pseudomonadota bacterium]
MAPALDCLLVEDDSETATNISDLLSSQNITLTWTADGQEGLLLASSEDFDVILLDRMLPNLDGMEIVKRMRAAGLTTPILMLSALGRSENRVEGLDAGVDDYLSKPFEPEELIARIRALHRRARRPDEGAVLLYGDIECHVKARTVHRQGKHISLSPKEFKLLHYFMQNAGEIVTREMLLRDVWNLSFDPQTNVIDVNIGRLRRKLEEGFDTPVLETIWSTGYRLNAG